MRFILGSAAVIVLSLACAGCGKGVSSASAADTAPPAAEAVTAIGCPKAPKPECVTVTSGGKTWDVTAAGVDLQRNVVVQVSGTPKGQGACGPALTEAQVEYTGLTCAKPAS